MEPQISHTWVEPFVPLARNVYFDLDTQLLLREQAFLGRPKGLFKSAKAIGLFFFFFCSRDTYDFMTREIAYGVRRLACPAFAAYLLWAFVRALARYLCHA